jgi:hypothetical protein
MIIEKKDYETAKKQQLISEGNPPRLTQAGEVVVEYGFEMAMNHPELSPEQQTEETMRYFPDELPRDRLQEAIEYYHASSVFSDEELGIPKV